MIASPDRTISSDYNEFSITIIEAEIDQFFHH